MNEGPSTLVFCRDKKSRSRYLEVHVLQQGEGLVQHSL